ncbi:MAG: ABC transporter permease [Bacteroidaceae bacterium]|nr:ABC transporter permease [Bacteroidaceae bacterium]
MKQGLLAHYLKVAVRSLERYKTQSIISVVGLAVGFVCLSLSALWIRYDNTYNTSIPGYKDLYAIGAVLSGHFMSSAPGGLVTAMDEWPEVEAKGKYVIYSAYIGDEMTPQRSLIAHTSLFDILPIEVVQGDPMFGQHLDWQSIALTDEYARSLFGTDDPVGQKLMVDGEEKTIVAIVRAFGPHTTFQFDLVEGMLDYYYTLPAAYMSLLVRLHPGDDVRASFEQKIAEYRPYERAEPIQGRLIPLNELHQYDRQKKLSYAHMRAFLLISVLLIACALINFLTLYLNRLRGRKREMALRLVHGSSHRGLVEMFSTELLVTLGCAIVLGMLGVFALKDVFADFADIQVGDGFIMGRALLIMLDALAVCLVLSLGAVEIVRRRTLSSSINPAAARRHVFSSVSIGVQLAVSITFVFCAVVMLRQLWFMRNTDMGARIKDTAAIHYEVISDRALHQVSVTGPNHISEAEAFVMNNGIENKLAALPAVTDVMLGNNFFSGNRQIMEIMVRNTLEGEMVETTFYNGVFDPANPIYGFSVLEGTLPTEESWNEGEVIISESLRDQLGLKEALGKTIYYSYSRDWNQYPPTTATVACVVKDILTLDLHVQPKPMILHRLDGSARPYKKLINIAYHHGMKHEVEEQIAEMMKPFPEVKYKIVFGEESFQQMLKSENNLSHLLTIVTLVAILIAVFGVYSIITLACRQRRKEIALRKIHGAKLKDILGMFVREYGLILVISSFVAFSVGYLIMHGWLEQYVKRTSLSLWVFVLIFVVTALLIALCVGSRVLSTARENPADVVKSE